MTEMTIAQMYKDLGEYIKKGEGNKRILLPCDPEGNQYFGCFYGVTPITEKNADDFILGDTNATRETITEYVIIG